MKIVSVANPYLKEFEAARKSKKDKFYYSLYTLREKLVKKYSWAIPNKKAISTLVKYSPVLEFGAGTGYWASLVHKAGGKIRAFDTKNTSVSWDFESNHGNIVESGSPKSILKKEHSDSTLFLCWPPYSHPFAFDTLSLFEGSTFIYVGEREGGCTGDVDFFALLSDKWMEREVIHIPQWDGIHDYMVVYDRMRK